MLNIDGKTFMNIQEAVQWLLDNNALPFQCTADYIANTEIGLGTIVNPSPAKVRIGSLIFFADSKVSTVIGLTENGFMVGDEYNDLVDDIVYVSNVQLNASGHLIVTLSNDDAIDAGLIKQITGMSIDGSQHLIASYNDGTTTDLGAIFTGNISISGNLTVSGGISGNAITGNSVIEIMSGYTFTAPSNNPETTTLNLDYAGVTKTGNKVTFVIAGTFEYSVAPDVLYFGRFTIPVAVWNKLFKHQLGPLTNVLAEINVCCASGLSAFVNLPVVCFKQGTESSPQIEFRRNTPNNSGIALNTSYDFRIECTFLLSENLA